MSEKGLITVSNEVYQYALKCRDKYLSKENKSALKLQEIIKKLESDVVSETINTYPVHYVDYEVSQLLADAIKKSEE